MAVPTFRRAELLPALLRRVREQTDRLDGLARVLVIDNDPERSAARAATGAEYVHEPRPGIAHVRQRALALSRDDELLVMIDDDVEPEEGWLDALISTWRAHRPAIVMGYVRYVWPPDADPWLAAGGFLRRTSHPTGTRLPDLATGNVLIDVARVRALGVDFDVSLGLAGGEDTHFGRAVVAAGGSIVACQESVVRDDVATDRVNVEFVRRRTIAHGEGRTHLELGGRSGATRSAARCGAVVLGLTRLIVFTAMSVLGKLSGRLDLDAVGRRRAWFALGRIRGALGVRRAEYARDDDAGGPD